MDSFLDLTTTDGRRFCIRPIQPDDRSHLQSGIQRLSPDSRYRRFHSARRNLSERELDFLTCCDGTNHIALVATAVDNLGTETEGIGVARFFRDPTDHQSGEIAIVIADPWQGSGVGLAMLTELKRRCLSVDVHRWKATVDSDNYAAIRTFTKVGQVIQSQSTDSRVHIEIDLKVQQT